MKIRWILPAVGLIVVITAALSLRTHRDVTTTSDQAYNYYLAGVECANRLYNEEALENFEAAVKLDSSFSSAWAYLSKLYYIMGQKEESKIAANWARELAEKLPERERLQVHIWTADACGDYDDLEKNIELMLERYPNEIEPHIYKAYRFWKQGKFKEAAEKFQTVLKINPNYALAYNGLGYLYAQMGDFTKAIEYLKKYAFIAPDQANPHDSLGEIYLMIGRYVEAVEQFRRALAVKPNLAVEPNNLGSTIQLHLAQALARKGRLREARESLDLAQKLSTSPWMNQYVLLEKIRIAETQQQYSEAVKLMTELEKSEGYDYELGPSLAAVCVRLGRADKIAELIKINNDWLLKAVQKSVGDSVEVSDDVLAEHLAECEKCDRIRNRGRWLEMFANRVSGHYDQALILAKSLLEEDISSYSKISLQYCVADAYFQLGEYRESLEAIQPVIEMNPNLYLAIFLKARTEMKVEDDAAAETTLKKFIAATYDADPDWVPRQQAFSLLSQMGCEAVQ